MSNLPPPSRSYRSAKADTDLKEERSIVQHSIRVFEVGACFLMAMDRIISWTGRESGRWIIDRRYVPLMASSPFS